MFCKWNASSSAQRSQREVQFFAPYVVPVQLENHSRRWKSHLIQLDPTSSISLQAATLNETVVPQAGMYAATNQ